MSKGMRIAVRTYTDREQEPTVIVGNDDDFMSKLRAYYLECASSFMVDAEDAKLCPDPLTATEEQIETWFSTEGDRLWIIDTFGPNPMLESEDFSGMATEFRADRERLLAIGAAD